MIWSACNRWGISPPEFPKIRGKLRWDDLADPLKAYLIAFEQTWEYEEDSKAAEMMKASTPRIGGKGKK